jgi:regulator of sigma E protease
MIATIHSVLAYAVVLGVLVFFHELGHYAAARANGVTVEVFSIGFGPSLLSWKAKSGTVWKLSALPLGGYVKMQGWGEEPAPEGEKAAPGSFAATSLGAKAMIVAAGPIANFILAFLVFAGLFMAIGRVEVAPIVSKIAAGMPAAAAGLQAGDKIVEVNGHKIQYFEDIQQIVGAAPGNTVSISYLRGSTLRDALVTTRSETEDGQQIGRLGIEGDEFHIQRYGPIGAIGAAAAETVNLSGRILNGIWNLVAHHKGLHDLGGTIRIAQLSGQVAALGPAVFINFIAMISVNLGLVNLLPIPILDGGHLLFYAGEAVLRRPIPRRAIEIGMRFGFALILSLFVFTTVNDLARLGAVDWVAHLFG